MEEFGNLLGAVDALQRGAHRGQRALHAHFARNLPRYAVSASSAALAGAKRGVKRAGSYLFSGRNNLAGWFSNQSRSSKENSFLQKRRWPTRRKLIRRRRYRRRKR